MIALVLAAVAAWFAGAAALAVIIGKAIANADRRERCCPHDEAEPSPERFEAWA